jgi:hypothetical protein
MGLERGPLSLVSTIEELLGRKSSGSDLETGNTSVGILHADHVAPAIHKTVGTNFSDKRLSLGWYSSLAEFVCLYSAFKLSIGNPLFQCYASYSFQGWDLTINRSKETTSNNLHCLQMFV